MSSYHSDDPIEIQRRTMPNPNRMDSCREAGVRHCTKSECPFFISCQMSIETERLNAQGGQPSLWQVPLEGIEAQTESDPIRPAQTESDPIRPAQTEPVVPDFCTPTKSKKKAK